MELIEATSRWFAVPPGWKNPDLRGVAANAKKSMEAGEFVLVVQIVHFVQCAVPVPGRARQRGPYFVSIGVDDHKSRGGP